MHPDVTAPSQESDEKGEKETAAPSLPDDPWGLAPGVTPKSIGGAILQSLLRMIGRLLKNV